MSGRSPASHDPSGHALAEAAHAAGVVEPVASLPNYTVSLEFIVRGTKEHAEAVAFTLASELTARSDVTTNGVSIAERTEMGRLLAERERLQHELAALENAQLRAELENAQRPIRRRLTFWRR